MWSSFNRSVLNSINMYGKLLFLAACTLGLIYTKNLDKLKVSIFYESHCPCSTDFITKNFYPVYKEMRGFLSVEFIPYGNTECTFEGGKWVFHCKGEKNGTHNCYANRVHACAVSKRLDENVTVEFVNCIINTTYTKEEVEACSAVSGMDVNYINYCTERNESDVLLSTYGNKTRTYNLSYIPAVVFNDVYNKTLDEYARKSFRNVVCELLHAEAPPSCRSIERTTL